MSLSHLKFCFVSAGLVLVLGASLNKDSSRLFAMAHGEEGQNKAQDGTNEKLQALLLERYDILKTIVESHKQFMECGPGNASALKDATVAMFHAEADLCPTDVERIKVYEKLIVALREYEDWVGRKAAAGRVTKATVAQAKVARLEAQIHLERLMLAQKALALSGRVVDMDGEPVANAQVALSSEQMTSAVHKALGAPPERKSDVQIMIEARVFSIKTASDSIAGYLYSSLGIRNISAEASLRMPVELTDEQADAFKRWVSTIPGASMLVSPKVTVVSGELVDQSLITQHEFIVGYKKPEASSEKPEPVLEKFTTGVKLNVTPELRRDGKVIVLKLAFSKRDLVQVDKDLDESGYEIERPVVDTVAVNASVLVVVGKSTLVPVAGLSSTGGIKTGEKPIQQTLLLIKPTILDLASGL